ncbi:HPP family protein [Aromatoleum diolicum]|uniref:HPP family protein n=1 Tax=Aromatoleum diolicum TaxID=75796 RepID=UPI0031B5B163
MSGALSWLRSFVPVAHAVSRRERVLSCAGALLGLFCAEWISRLALGESHPWFIAPMGASAVLLFAVPSSPLAQPWSIVGGNVISALVGVTCAKFIGHPGLAAALAVAVSIGAMFQLRCLHPPGGAVALTSVLGGSSVTELGYGFAVWPVAIDSLCLLAAALAFNMALGRRYPQRAHEHAHPHLTADPVPSARLGVTLDDLNEVLAARGELLDVSSEDLEEILVAAELRASRRRFGEIRCADIMSGDVVSVSPQASIGEAWALLSRHRVKAMPVVSAERILVGIVSLHDFFVHRDAPYKLRFFNGIDVHRTVQDLMSPEVVTARPEQPIVELVHLFADVGLHHVPVVDMRGAVIGMVTQSDLVAALVRMRLEEPEMALAA